MSLFDYASEKLINELEKSKSPMLSVSMGMEPVMPMAQGGGLSTVQNSLNINGEPHRLAYINPSEESLLQQLGGSGRKIDGIPSYYSEDATADEANTAANAAAEAEAAAEAAAIGEQAAYSDKGSQAVGLGFGDPTTGAPGVESPALSLDPTLDIKNPDPYSVPEKTFDMRSELSKGKGLSIDLGLFSTLGGLGLGPLGMALGKGLDAALGTSVGVNTGIGAQSMGYGDTGTGTQGGSGQDDDDDDGSTGNDAGGDDAADYIIKEKIAAVKKVPVEEVTVEEVKRAKRLTAAQRVTGTRLEDILDDIYGSGKGAGLLGITTNNTGTA